MINNKNSVIKSFANRHLEVITKKFFSLYDWLVLHVRVMTEAKTMNIIHV